MFIMDTLNDFKFEQVCVLGKFDDQPVHGVLNRVCIVDVDDTNEQVKQGDAISAYIPVTCMIISPCGNIAIEIGKRNIANLVSGRTYKLLLGHRRRNNNWYVLALQIQSDEDWREYNQIDDVKQFVIDCGASNIYIETYNQICDADCIAGLSHTLNGLDDVLYGGFGKFEFGEQVEITLKNHHILDKDVLEVFTNHDNDHALILD